MSEYRYDFEKPIAELEKQLEGALKTSAREKHPDQVRTQG